MIGRKAYSYKWFPDIGITGAVLGGGKDRREEELPLNKPSMNAETAKTKSIVFVEDNAIVLMAYKNRLQQEGFHVEPALDGVEAMKILTQFCPICWYSIWCCRG